ncbi:DUF983 domain-containing protein [Cohaesibacter haloalkalitolerans]|uniref:DUF983 domain-containing protein n=1 Tax=Cohaesibacter haloalkalitolerans TaxID=1162980 RepID=UPI000E64BB38|nr:DUF983 domain-containing protein [Cohaesibacter haloalkalitolerans]
MAESGGSVARTALAGKCPRCGKGRLYRSFLKVADRCDVCGLDYGFIDSGDGPAVFVIMIVGFISTGGLLYTEFTYEPPVWLQVIIWAPVAILLCLAFLYWLKGALIAQQYRTKAEQGRRISDAGSD